MTPVLVGIVAGIAGGCRPMGPVQPFSPDVLGADALHDATFELTSMGARPVATPAEAEAQAHIERAFAAAGLHEVLAEPFTFDAWRPGTASLTLGGETFAVEALSPSPATDLSLTLSDEAGGALLVGSTGSSRAEAFLAAVSRGSAALIRVTEELGHNGESLVEVGHLLDGANLPAVAVDQPTGEFLAAAMAQPIRIEIAPNIALDHTSYNVVGRWPAATEGGSRVFVVAHYDSWHPSESAFDNALGVAGLLQLAQRAVLAGPPKREVVFLATSGEEQGLRGAQAWALAHDAEIQAGDVVLVLDVMWSGEGAYVALATDALWATRALDAAAAEGLEALDGGDPGFGSDHVPFVARGASAIWLGRWPDRHYHTVADTLDALDREQMAAALRTNWRLLEAAAW